MRRSQYEYFSHLSRANPNGLSLLSIQWKSDTLSRYPAVVAEYLFDERRDFALTPFENDLAGALRLAVNDAASTEFLFGWVQDIDTSARFLFLEASRRLADQWTLELEIRSFLDQPSTAFLFALRDDDLLQLVLQYHF